MTSNTHIDNSVPRTNDSLSSTVLFDATATTEGRESVGNLAYGTKLEFTLRAWFKVKLWSIWLVACLSRSPVGEELQPKLKDECTRL